MFLFSKINRFINNAVFVLFFSDVLLSFFFQKHGHRVWDVNSVCCRYLIFCLSCLVVLVITSLICLILWRHLLYTLIWVGRNFFYSLTNFLGNIFEFLIIFYLFRICKTVKPKMVMSDVGTLGANAHYRASLVNPKFNSLRLTYFHFWKQNSEIEHHSPFRT